MTKSTKHTKTPGEIPAVIKDDFIQVTVDGKAWPFNSSHPTFSALKKALEAHDWKKVPKLLSIAQTLVQASAGSVEVINGAVFYKGTQVDSRLTNRILEMIKEDKDINHMLLFMDDLYQNPEPLAIKEFYDWLVDNDLPITDDGAFIGYKSVDRNYKDQHTHTIDNRPGQVIMMPRNLTNRDWRNQCSSGFHICSKQYGLYGQKVMAVKVYPRDVVAAPEGGKMRVCMYEVLKELGSPKEDLFKLTGFSEIEKKLVIEIGAERKELIAMLLSSKEVKKLLKKEKIKKTTITKASYARLKSMALRYNVVPEKYKEQKDNTYPLQEARKAAGLSIGQIAKQMKDTYKDVAKFEKQENPNRVLVDRYLTAIAKLVGIRDLSCSAISYPKAVATV